MLPTLCSLCQPQRGGGQRLTPWIALPSLHMCSVPDMAIAGRMADFLVKVSLLKSVLIWAAVQQHESVTCWYGAHDGLRCIL